MPRDPYQRAWVKFPTYLLEQREYRRLSFEDFGVFALSLLYSTSKSQDIGFFLDRFTGRPWGVDDIAYAIRPDNEDPEHWVTVVAAAFRHFVRNGLMTHDLENGYAFAESVISQYLNENNLANVRAAYRRRTNRSRAKKKGAKAAEPVSNVVPMARPEPAKNGATS